MGSTALLAGPRGRRLCLALATEPSGPTPEEEELRLATFYASYELDPGRATSTVVLAFAAGDGATHEPDLPRVTPGEVARLLGAVPLRDLDGPALLGALATAVDFARYWQEPDGEDALVATPEVRGALLRVAEHVARATEAAWWTTPVDRAEQWTVTFTDGPRPVETAGAVAERLVRWRSDAVREETRAAAERPHDPEASWSGTWWSSPPAELTRTTRALPGQGPVGLWRVEDAGGWDEATVRPVPVALDARVYEIDGPEAWAELCRRYPLKVTASRRHDWYRTTGRDSRWLQPDWSRAAHELDAVHLTVAGYLTTAGRAVPVRDGVHTVLAGWNPDETYWLTDAVSPAAPAHIWTRDDDGAWHRDGSGPPGT